MAAAVGCPPEQMLYALPSQAEQVAAVGRQLGLETILAIVQILDHTAARLRVSMHGRTLVEMAIVRICQLENWMTWRLGGRAARNSRRHRAPDADRQKKTLSRGGLAAALRAEAAGRRN